MIEVFDVARHDLAVFRLFSDKRFGDVLAVDVVPEAIRYGIKIVGCMKEPGRGMKALDARTLRGMGVLIILFYSFISTGAR